MRVRFYKEIKEEKELILEKELPLNEVSIYSHLLKKKIEKELEEKEEDMTKLATFSEDFLVSDEVIREITIRPFKPNSRNK